MKQNKATTLNTKEMADQAAAMMIQDMRIFIQSNQQVMTVAISKAIAMSLNPTDPAMQKAGQGALEALEKLMMALPKFAGSINTAANDIINDFGKNKSQ